MLSNAYINGLKVDLGRVEARQEQESTVLGPNHPQYLRTMAEVQGLRDKIKSETKKLVAGLGNAVEQSRRREHEPRDKTVIIKKHHDRDYGPDRKVIIDHDD